MRRHQQRRSMLTGSANRKHNRPRKSVRRTKRRNRKKRHMMQELKKYQKSQTMVKKRRRKMKKSMMTKNITKRTMVRKTRRRRSSCARTSKGTLPSAIGTLNLKHVWRSATNSKKSTLSSIWMERGTSGFLNLPEAREVEVSCFTKILSKSKTCAKISTLSMLLKSTSKIHSS